MRQVTVMASCLLMASVALSPSLAAASHQRGAHKERVALFKRQLRKLARAAFSSKKGGRRVRGPGRVKLLVVDDLGGLVAVDRAGRLYMGDELAGRRGLRRIQTRVVVSIAARVLTRLGDLAGRRVDVAPFRSPDTGRARAKETRRWQQAMDRVERLFITLGLDPMLIGEAKVRSKPRSHRFASGYRLADGVKSPTMIGYPGDHVSATTWKRLEVSTDGRLLITTMLQPEDQPVGMTGQREVGVEAARAAFPELDLAPAVKRAFSD